MHVKHKLEECSGRFKWTKQSLGDTPDIEHEQKFPLPVAASPPVAEHVRSLREVQRFMNAVQLNDIDITRVMERTMNNLNKVQFVHWTSAELRGGVW
jgi:hypothetical protein